MNAQQLLDAGNLAEAIEAQNAAVKAHPSDIDARYLLSVLLCFSGDLDRAFLQLDTVAKLDSELGMASNVYRSLITAEAHRRSFFNDDARPLLPPDAPPSADSRLDALLALRRGDSETARQMLDRALEQETPVHGKLNGDPFTDLRDYDDFLGPILELYAGGNYLWLPLQHVRKLEIRAPAHQLDLLWAPASLEDAAGTEASVHLPVLYEGSHLAEEAALALGRMTDWIDRDGIGFRGVGQKVLLTRHQEDSRELGLLEARSIEVVGAPAGEAGRG